jgi:hypothetical protein
MPGVENPSARMRIRIRGPGVTVGRFVQHGISSRAKTP